MLAHHGVVHVSGAVHLAVAKFHDLTRYLWLVAATEWDRTQRVLQWRDLALFTLWHIGLGGHDCGNPVNCA